jgi:hypothetical protein
MPEIQPVELKTLKDFYSLMAASRMVRCKAVAALLDGDTVSDDAVVSLANVLSSLEEVPEAEGRKVLSLDRDRFIGLDIDYEINETRKDLFYLEEG